MTQAPAESDARQNDRSAIQRVVDEWVFCRDNGEWESLRALFTDDGRMTTNGASFTADEFVAYARKARAAGILSHHITGPSRIRVVGDHALAETQATLNIRTHVHDNEVDVTALVRYLDRLRRVDRRWRIQDRLPLYLLDRMIPVRPDAQLILRDDLLAQCPTGARFLVYVRLASGASTPDPMPITFGTTESDTAFTEAEAWLHGTPAPPAGSE